jgi:hypothetical protein
LNEIHELRAQQARERSEIVPVEASAFYWLENIFQPVATRLHPLSFKSTSGMDAIESYCQILEHKWYLSERAGHDVGHLAAVEDYLANIVKKLSNTDS